MKSVIAEKLSNPFSDGDIARDQLENCLLQIQEQQRIINMLIESVTLLMKVHNKKHE